MLHPALSDDEIGRRGKELYEASVRQNVESDVNVGKIVCIDVETGDYEIDASGIEAARRIHARRPNAPVYGVRIGYDAVYSLGGVLTKTPR